MSKYKLIETKITDLKTLREVLEKLAPEFDVEPTFHQEPVHLHGFTGDIRPELAHVVIDRRFLSGMANDVGWFQEDDGTIVAIVSAYDSKVVKTRNLVESVAWDCMVAQTLEQARREGYTILETVRNVNGRVTDVVLDYA